MSDSPFSSDHRARFQELRTVGELYALNSSEQRDEFGPWHVSGRLAGPDETERRIARFRTAVRRAAMAGGAPYRVDLLNWWISKLARGKRLMSIEGLIQRSVEYCEELEASVAELGRGST